MHTQAPTVQKIFERLQQANPHPRTELIYSSPFELLVAVMLSAQATDVSVNLATRKLFSLANTPATMLELGLDNIIEQIRSIGLYRNKAKNLLATCELLLRDFQGQVPNQRQALESLPGVGRKTANVLLNTLFGQPVIAVDTHIFRVAQRMGLAKGETPLAIELQLEQIVPTQFQQHAHHWLILHGRYTCKARNPSCQTCQLADLCPKLMAS